MFYDKNLKFTRLIVNSYQSKLVCSTKLTFLTNTRNLQAFYFVLASLYPTWE
jgi:hypothetical protein